MQKTNFRDLEYLLKHFAEQPEYKKLLARVPVKQFFSMQNWPVVQKRLHRYMMFWLHRPILQSAQLRADTEKSFKMSIGTLHYLLSDTLSVGYLIELPKNVKLEITPSYVVATIGKVGGSIISVTDLPPFQHELNDQHLSVYVQNTTLLIACQRYNIDFLT